MPFIEYKIEIVEFMNEIIGWSFSLDEIDDELAMKLFLDNVSIPSAAARLI